MTTYAETRRPGGLDFAFVPERVGAVLGERFEVVRLLARGGLCSVYLARDRLLRGFAAVKILREDHPDTRRRFAEEAHLLANLRHPHLVQVLAVGATEDGAPYMALEYLAGPSLEARLRQSGPLPWREVVEIAAQVAEALLVLHRAGVVHRDVKPANIVAMESPTGRPLVKLLDLGVAKVRAGSTLDVEEGASTEVGAIVGTRGYFPPEAGLGAVEPSFDVYALGVTIYQLCTGELPTPGEYRPLREARPTCAAPPTLEALVGAARAELPDERIATIEEVLQRLDALRTAQVFEGGAVRFAGCFELLEVLGVGAKAEVYRAYDRDARRYVAIKQLRERARESEEERAHFAREARVLAAVRHLALPELLACQISGCERPYIVMSLMKGRCVGDFGAGREGLTPAEVVAAGRQLASALVALHERGILHRDLHKSNVLIELGREVRAGILDLGMAELTDRFYLTAEDRYLTPPEARTRLGNGGLERLAWSAPEAKAGKGWTDRSDVFSLGLLLYYLLTSKRPFRPGEVEMTPPSEYVPACPLALEGALAGALAHDPEQRSTAQGLLAALDEAAEELAERPVARREVAEPCEERGDEAKPAADGAARVEKRSEQDDDGKRCAPAGVAVDAGPRDDRDQRPDEIRPRPTEVGVADPTEDCRSETGALGEPGTASAGGMPTGEMVELDHRPPAQLATHAVVTTPVVELGRPGQDPPLAASSLAEDVAAPAAVALQGQPASSASRPVFAMAPRTLSIVQAMALAAALALAWWGGRMTAISPEPVMAAAPPSPADMLQPVPGASPASVSPQSSVVREPLTMGDALAAATPALQRCAAQAGGTMVIEFVIAAKDDRFTNYEVLESSAASVRCVDAALVSVRFAPGAAQTFVKEYSP